jgi:hypothetical protein
MKVTLDLPLPLLLIVTHTYHDAKMFLVCDMLVLEIA